MASVAEISGNDAGSRRSPDLSLVVPCYNERYNIRAFYARACEVFDDTDVAVEVVFVDDGSADGTFAEVNALMDELDETGAPLPVQGASFSRNFGKESAMLAGLNLAHGDNFCFIDADLQQDPEVALQMYRYLVSHPECDVVAAYQEMRKENKLVAALKGAFYRVFNATSDEIELPENMSDFRVFRRPVAEALMSLPEAFRFSKGLFAWVGFNTHEMPYVVNERNAGESSWSVRSLFKYAFSGITSFSTWPLKVTKYIGFGIAMLALLYLLYVIIVDYFIFGIDIPGYATLACLILIFGGLQLLFIGLVGDYLARMYIEGKRRPSYIIKERREMKAGR